MKLNYEVEVTAELIAGASNELLRILIQQTLAYHQRWHSSWFAKKVIPILRYLGLIASLLGFITTVVFLVLGPRWCPAWVNLSLMAPLFFIFILIFYFLPAIQAKIVKSTKSNLVKQCQKRVARHMSKAHRLQPYTAEYMLKGNLLTCFRCVDDDWKVYFFKKLSGVAFQGDSVTVVFKKHTSIHPYLLVFHHNSKMLRSALEHLNLAICLIPSDLEINKLFELDGSRNN